MMLKRAMRLAACCVLLSTTAYADSLNLSGSVFGTTYSVKARSVQTNGEEQQIVDSTLEKIDQTMSTYRNDSDVSRFNAHESTDWFPVDLETAKVVSKAQSLSSLTDGAFDITVGPLVGLWNFGAASNRESSGQPSVGKEFSVPSDDQIAEALSSAGYQILEVRLDPPALKKVHPGLQIDLSAIAKGYAVDAVFDALPHLEHCMVEIGGEVRVRGKSDVMNDVPWRIGIEAPTKTQREVDSIIGLADEAMATSGDYRNFYVHDGKTYSHTIDPKSGRPVEHDLASVTILAADCATADALATAMLVMGPEKAKRFAEENQTKVLLVQRESEETFKRTTVNFPMLDLQPSAKQQQAESKSSAIGMFIAAGLIFGCAILAMSLGTIIANRRIQGSCGGMAGIKDAGGNTICDMCTKPTPECTGSEANA